MHTCMAAAAATFSCQESCCVLISGCWFEVQPPATPRPSRAYDKHSPKSARPAHSPRSARLYVTVEKTFQKFCHAIAPVSVELAFAVLFRVFVAVQDGIQHLGFGLVRQVVGSVSRCTSSPTHLPLEGGWVPSLLPAPLSQVRGPGSFTLRKCVRTRLGEHGQPVGSLVVEDV